MALKIPTLLWSPKLSAHALGTTAVERTDLLSVFCRVRRKSLRIQPVNPDRQKELQAQPGPPYFTLRAEAPLPLGQMAAL